MKNVSWGISGYLVLLEYRVIAQFDNCGWAMEFQKHVSNLRKGQQVTIIYDEGNSTMVTDDDPKKQVKKTRKKIVKRNTHDT